MISPVVIEMRRYFDGIIAAIEDETMSGRMLWHEHAHISFERKSGRPLFFTDTYTMEHAVNALPDVTSIVVALRKDGPRLVHCLLVFDGAGHWACIDAQDDFTDPILRIHGVVKSRAALRSRCEMCKRLGSHAA